MNRSGAPDGSGHRRGVGAADGLGGDGPGRAEAVVAALAGLPGVTPRRLAKLLDGFPPVVAWRAVQAGTHPGDPERRFARAARRTDVDEVVERQARLGVHTLLPGGRGYPSALIGDPGAPAVLFALGDPMALEGGPRVAIVGTRSATHYGRRVASELAGELASSGVSVVSGLAAGIDAAAHAGTLRATADERAVPVGVVGTGLDVVYPSSSRELWGAVAERGVLLSESALGTPPHPGVFPARNRIIAALSDVVVVVESHARGGALYTAEAAARRAIPVCAVPGSVHSRASEGSNALLVDGCIPVRDATDVMVTIGLVRAGKNLAGLRGARSQVQTASAAGDGRSGSERRRRPGQLPPGRGVEVEEQQRPPRDRGGRDPIGAFTPAQRVLLTAIDETPTPFESILLRTDLSIAAAAEACDQLVERGILRSGAGWWSTT